jgi:uroporphyrinogen decarboxylase
MPVMLMQGARELGLPLETYFGEAKRLADGQLALVERYNQDAVFAIPHIVQDVLPWKSGIDFHPSGPPSVNKMVIRSYEDILALEVPDPTAHPYLRKSLQAAAALGRRVKGDRLIVGAVIGPFSLPSMLMGTRKFLGLLLEPPEVRQRYLKPLLDKMLTYTRAWIRAQHEAGCDLVVVAEGISSATIIDEVTFREFALPTMERLQQGIQGYLALEFVGRATPFLRYARDLGFVAWLVGEEDGVVEPRHRVGPRGALVGAINNLKLLRWRPERVEFEARRLIREAGPGFILSNQGPEIPWETSPENIQALLRAAHLQKKAGSQA